MGISGLRQRSFNLTESIFRLISCAQYRTGLECLTLSQLWSERHQVLVFYQAQGITLRPELWPCDYIAAPWANTDNVIDLIAFLQQSGPGRDFHTFFVSQGIATPTAIDVFRRPFGSLLNDLGSEVTREVVNWLAETATPSRPFVNIVTVDFCHLWNFCSSVVDQIRA